MELEISYNTREEANKLLSWANEQNPGPWIDHCKNVAKVAEAIANKCGLDPNKAYVFGLLYDIGYYDYRNGKGKTCHIFTGYDLMISKNYESIANICLSHSFPIKNIKAYSGNDFNCCDEQSKRLMTFLDEIEYNDYDKLIQLSDCIGSAQGLCIMEKRMINVVMRHGFNEFSIKKWDSYFSLKNYFDEICKMNIYELFYEEIIKNSI